MLENSITSKTRITLLLKLFLNSNTTAYLRNLETECGESTNAIRMELIRLEKAGLIQSKIEGNKKVYQANTKHQLFPTVHNILLKHVGIDKIIDEIIVQTGNLEKAFVTGKFAKGIESKFIDLLIVGIDLNIDYLTQLIKKAERIIKLKIRYIAISPQEEESYLSEISDALLIWGRTDTSTNVDKH